MKDIPKFCITLLVKEDIIRVYPTIHGSSYLVSTKSVKELRANLENYVERVKSYLRRLNGNFCI